MARPPVYEVRCERCQTTFPPEWKRCIHCGGPLTRGRSMVSSGVGPAPAEHGRPVELAPSEPEEESEEVELQSRGRNLLWIFMAVLAALMSALRTCSGS